MKIVYLDVVGWEPLTMRFRPTSAATEASQSELVQFLEVFFKERAEEQDSNLKYWKIHTEQNKEVVVNCEFFGEEDIFSLAEKVDARFPLYTKLEVGENLTNSAAGDDIEWISITNPSRR